MRIRKRCFIEMGQAYQTSNVLECPNRVVFITVVLVNLFLIGRWLLYNIVFVSVIHQHESAIGILLSPPSTTSLPLSPHLTPVVVTEDWFALPESCREFPLAGCFMYGNAYVSMLPLSHLLLPLLCPQLVLYVCISIASLENMFINTIFLDSIYMC